MTITPVSPAPTLLDPANFAGTMETFVASLNQYIADLNAQTIATILAATFNGTTFAPVSGSPVTTFVAPGTSGSGKLTLVRASVLDPLVGGNLGAGFIAYAWIGADGANARILTQHDGAHFTITLSGNNVQMTQGQGSNCFIFWTYFSF